MLGMMYPFAHVVVISPHQDVFSRYMSGSGAPYWSIEAMGINPRRVHQTGAAVVHAEWKKQGWGGEEGRETAERGEVGDWPDSALPSLITRSQSKRGSVIEDGELMS